MDRLLDVINEVLDSPWHKEHDEEMTNRLKDTIETNKGKDETFSNIKAYKLEGNNGHLLSFVRNGKLEAHHVDKDEQSGEMTNKNHRHNPRFLSTMIDHLKTHALNKGRSVRITSYEGSELSNTYKRIAEKLAKKENRKLEYSKEVSLGSKVDTITVHPIGYTASLEEKFSK